MIVEDLNTNEDSAKDVPLLQTPRAAEVRLIENADQLDAAVLDLNQATGPFAIDAERASGFKYSQRAYLLQVYRRGSAIYLIDVAALAPQVDRKPFEVLGELLSTDEWILHAATQDLPCLGELGLRPRKLFDTELGSRLLGLARVGLGAVTEELLGFRLAKEHSAVDWSQRPMNEDWLNYAALDVDVLLDLRNELAQRLRDAAKLEWAEQEFDNLVGFQPKPAKVDRWRGINGLHEVKDTRKLAIAREVWLAREALGQKQDVSPGRLIPDSSILAVVKNTPRSRSELASYKAFAGRASRTYLDTWWKAIEVGSATNDLPALKLVATGIPNHRSWPTRYPDADARLKTCRSVVQNLAEKILVPTENLLTPDYLRELCWNPPANLTGDEVSVRLKSFGARTWQVGILGEPLSEALASTSASKSDAD
jgi:ribonuclease D